MKFTIAAKVGLLAAIVSLIMTALVGWWALGRSSDVLTDQARGNLTDDARLRVYDLVTDFRYLRKDVRDLANPAGMGADDRPDTVGMVKKLLSPSPDPAARRSLEEEFTRLLERPENGHYLELTCLDIRRADDPVPVLAVGRPSAGAPLRPTEGDYCRQDQTALASLIKRPRDSKRQLFPVRALPRAGKGDEATPMLLTVAFPVGSDRYEAMLMLTIDFEEFVQRRARVLPRHLLFLTDDKGRLLVHPSPAVQERIRRASAGLSGEDLTVHDEPALSEFAPCYDHKTAEQQLAFRKERGAAMRATRLPNLAYRLSLQEFTTEAQRAYMARHWADLEAELRRQAAAIPDLRFTAPTPNSAALRVACRDGADLNRVQEALTAREREHLPEPPAWGKDLDCQTFAVRFLFLNPDLDLKDDASLNDKEARAEPRFFGLALALGIEEVQRELGAFRTRMLLGVVGLCGVAALVAWVFSVWLTRPLKRITAATERLAEGDYDVALPSRRRDEIGVLARSFVHMIDQVKKRQEAVEEVVARMRTILNTAAEGIVTFDQHGEIVGFNQAAERIFGYAAAEVTGTKINRLMELPDRPAPREGLPGEDGQSDSVRMVNTVVRTRGEVTGRRRDGATFPMEVAFSEVPHGSRRLITGIFRDITERKKAEREIHEMNETLDQRVRLRTLELEEAMGKLETALEGAQAGEKAQEAFLASMSHELRNPLNAIIGFTEMLIESHTEEELVSDLEKINTSGRHLLDIVNDILDWAKVKAGKMTLELSDFQVEGLLRDIDHIVRPLARKYDNELVFEIGPGLAAMHADQKRLRQILINLLSNACKFTEKGRVTLRVSRETDGGHDWLRFAVADTGIGMTAEQVQKLGTPFNQVDSTLKRKRGGTGLGVAISKTFCELMGGRLLVESAQGKGSTFTALVPAVVHEAADAPPRVDTVPPAPAGTRRGAVPNGSPAGNVVLVVDDDPNVRELMERFLKLDGMQVVTAGSGEEGLRLAKQLRPAAITLDVMMPGIDGWAMLAALKTDAVTADIPVIMVTIEDNRKRGFALGAADYVTKPIDWGRLSGLLRKYARLPGEQPVLVVEDDPVNRDLMVRALEREGLRVERAENGLVALERLRAGLRPCLILLDLMMPEMDGFEFLERVRQHADWRLVPVIVVTARDLTPEDRRRLNGGVAEILGKGAFPQEQLLEHLRQQVRRYVNWSAPKEGSDAAHSAG